MKVLFIKTGQGEGAGALRWPHHFRLGGQALVSLTSNLQSQAKDVELSEHVGQHHIVAVQAVLKTQFCVDSQCLFLQNLFLDEWSCHCSSVMMETTETSESTFGFTADRILLRKLQLNGCGLIRNKPKGQCVFIHTHKPRINKYSGGSAV